MGRSGQVGDYDKWRDMKRAAMKKAQAEAGPLDKLPNSPEEDRLAAAAAKVSPLRSQQIDRSTSIFIFQGLVLRNVLLIYALFMIGSAAQG